MHLGQFQTGTDRFCPHGRTKVVRTQTKLLISIAIPLLILLLPSRWIPIEGLTTIEHRLIAIFATALLFWVLEPIPVFATSLLIILLELTMVSDKSFILFQAAEGASQFGTVLSYKAIMATFASPIIMLFLGGFFLAMAATKYQLDVNMARVLLKPFGTQPRFVLLGLMLITAVFSMFMSNTATTAMMLAILAPVLTSFDKEDRGRIAFALGIPFAANIGGIGTPIGTPPNAIALKYLTGEQAIGFGTWMSFAVPVAAILLALTWMLLLWFYKPTTDTLTVSIEGKFRKNWQALTVYVTFGVTVFLWLFDFLHGMNPYIVAMIPVTVFSATRIITTKDLQRMSWDVLWLVSGGIALGLGLEQSGLAQHLIDSIPFAEFNAYVLVFSATLATILMATFMSHTATANLLMPIMAVLGTTLPSLEPLGGARMIILAVAFSSSLAMSLPISTPPNAMAHATGYIETKHMVKTGVIVGCAGLLSVYALIAVLNGVGFL